jgi:hypothetical protein
MIKQYISLGCQCTNPSILQQLKIKTESLPFDWMLSNPKFVFEILEMLLTSNISIEDIVKKHFFICDKRAGIYTKAEHYTENSNGSAQYNVKYDVLFPHENKSYEETTEKYIRRFMRLKELIYNNDVFITFIFITPSSTGKGNFTINQNIIIKDAYIYLKKINELFKEQRKNNYKILVYYTDDAFMNFTNEKIDDKMGFTKIDPMDEWPLIMPEITAKLKEHL